MNDLAARCARCGARIVLVAAFAVSMHACTPSLISSDVADGSVITEDEIGSSHAFNAYDAVYKLRREFLVSRGKMSLDPAIPPALPNVYVDEMFYGDVSALRGIPASAIELIRFYHGPDAQYKYGRGNAAGVIDVITKH